MGAVDLILFDTDEERVTRIRAALQDSPHLVVYMGDGPAATAELGIDALWVTPMQGERFGLLYPAPGTCFIGENIQSMLAKGLPPYVIASHSNPAPEWQRTALQALRKALFSFNLEHGDCIRRVGTIPENLGITEENLELVTRILISEWQS